MLNMSVTRALGLGLWMSGLVMAGACGGGDDDNKNSAVLKFCNPLSLQNNQPLDLTLEVGSEKPVALTAASGTCTPKAKGAACIRVPLGVNVPVVMKMGTDRLASEVLEIKAGEEWLVLASLDDMSRPALEGGSLDLTKAKCADLAFEDIFDTSGGTTPPPAPSPTPTPRI
jgi:hypothetical protein